MDIIVPEKDQLILPIFYQIHRSGVGRDQKLSKEKGEYWILYTSHGQKHDVLLQMETVEVGVDVIAHMLEAATENWSQISPMVFPGSLLSYLRLRCVAWTAKQRSADLTSLTRQAHRRRWTSPGPRISGNTDSCRAGYGGKPVPLPVQLRMPVFYVPVRRVARESSRLSSSSLLGCCDTW